MKGRGNSPRKGFFPEQRSGRAATLPLLLLLSATAFPADAQSAPAVSPAASQALNETSAAHRSDTSAATTGIAVSEVLHGNGTGIGYYLSHHNVLTDTLIVRVDGRLLHADTDYWIEADSGVLFFAQPLSRSDSASAEYRYVDGGVGANSLMVPALQLGFGKSTSLQFGMGALGGDAAGPNGSLFGLGLNSNFGSGGLSSLTSLFYFSNAQSSSNTVLNAPAAATKAAAPAATSGSGQFIYQNLALHSGGLGFHATYQDIGKNFGGLDAIKSSLSGNKAAQDEVGLMTGEKGIRRLGYGLGIALDPHGKSPDGLTLDWNQLQDDKGGVSEQTAAFTSGGFQLHYNSRDISEKFTHFQGLREAGSADWAHQKGLKTTDLGFGLNFGGASHPSRGGLNFTDQSFGDKTGSLSREMWNLNTGKFGMMWLDRRADAGFKRMNDLSDADKTALALDLYQQYDPNAQAKQVTAKDKAQTAKEAGFDRSALRFGGELGKTGGINFSQMRVRSLDATQPAANGAGFSRDSLTLDAGPLSFAMVSRKTDAGFSRIGDLADIEKNYLALDIRREFDPTATLAQVTQKERDQAVKEAGLARNNLLAYLKLSKDGKSSLAYSDLTMTSASTDTTQPNLTGALQRRMLAFTGKNLQFSWLDQSISSDFSRLSALSDLEHAHFANEVGLRRQEMTFSWQLNKVTHLAISRLNIGGTQDAVAAAAAAASKAGADVNAAMQAAAGGLSRENLTFETKGFSVSANKNATGKDFARAPDLAMPDADKNTINAERGFNRSDLTLHFNKWKWLTLDDYQVSAADELDKLGHSVYKQNLLLAPIKTLKINLQRDGDIATTDSQANGTAHSLLTLDQDFGKSMLFNLFRDSSVTYSNGLTAQTIQTDHISFDADKADKDKKNSFSYETKGTTYQNGTFEDIADLNVHIKPAKSFAFQYAKWDVNSDDTQTPPSKTDQLDFQWQATKAFAVIGGFSQKDAAPTAPTANVNTVSVGLQGQPVKNFTLAAKFDEVHQEATNTKDTADFSISNAKPIRLGPLQNLTITARYASLNDQRKLLNETMTGRASWTLWKNEFLLDYGGLTNKDGSTISRLYSFRTDPNPKRWFHGTFYYKSRTLLSGEEKLIRRFTADARLSKRTNLVYTYGTLPEDEKGNITPLTAADMSLKHTFAAGLDASIYYRLNDNMNTKIMTRALGFSLEMPLMHNGKLELGYSREANGFANQYYRSNRFRIGVDCKLDSERSVSVSLDMDSPDSGIAPRQMQGHFDISNRF